MKTIDLHQDIILTFESNPQNFFSDAGKTMMPEYNAGIFADYENTFDLVLGAIWPYTCVGDMTDPHNRVITFAPESIDKLIQGYKSWSSRMPLVLTKADLQQPGCKLLMHLEGHDTLSSVADLRALYDKGVRSFGWTWNQNTPLSGACINQEQGLTALGREVMKAMNERGMIIDTAHMSWQGMRDILQNSTKPILNSHSNVYTLREHERNIPDDIIDLFPKNGGVIGFNIYQLFLSPSMEVTIDQYIDQIEYVINRIGDDYVALGTDWHGVPANKTVSGMNHVSGVHLLRSRMTERLGSVVTEKFFSENALRVINANLS